MELSSILIPLASSRQNLYDLYLLLCVRRWTADGVLRQTQFLNKKLKINNIARRIYNLPEAFGPNATGS